MIYASGLSSEIEVRKHKERLIPKLEELIEDIAILRSWEILSEEEHSRSQNRIPTPYTAVESDALYKVINNHLGHKE